MSLKPEKKSDVRKDWMKSRRERAIRIAPEYHLIVTEGTKTEPLYFKGLEKEINCKYPGRITIKGEGKNTLSLLERATRIVASDPDRYQHIWLVYDKDDFPEDNFDNTEFRCRDISTDRVIYHAIWSNECIELWFLLHFMYLQSTLKRDEYFPKLSKYLRSDYAKNRDDIYELLKPYLKKAISNAKRLKEENEGKSPSKCNPGTTVYEIFEKLEAYL